MSPWDIRVFLSNLGCQETPEGGRPEGRRETAVGAKRGDMVENEQQRSDAKEPLNDLELFEKWLQEERVDIVRPERGDLLEGTIVEITPHEVLVDIGAKVDAVVPRSDLERLAPEVRQQLRVGMRVPVLVTFVFEELNEIEVSIALALQEQDWLRARELMERGELVECEVLSYNRGGLIVRFGQLRGFVPLSHLVEVPRNTPPEERARYMERLVGKKLLLKIIEANRAQRRLIFSQREALRAWREQRKDELLATLKEGDVVRGTVRSFTDFGVFVDLGGVDGLIHKSELAWEEVDDPSKVLSLGQEIEAMVIKVDREERRIGLSLKRLHPEPWLEKVKELKEGEIVKAVVTNVTDFGAFVRLENGLEGLIHVSHMPLSGNEKPQDILQPGDEINVRIVEIDRERQRISLSLRDVPQWDVVSPEEASAETGPSDDKQGTEQPVEGEEGLPDEAPSQEPWVKVTSGANRRREQQ